MLSFVLVSLTCEAIDVAQVDVCDIGQVISQGELAAATEINSTSIGADIANHADDTACEDAWRTTSKNIHGMERR